MSTIGSDFLTIICNKNPQYDNIYNFIENIVRMAFILDRIEDFTNIKFERVYQNIIKSIEVLKTQKEVKNTSDISIIVSSMYTCTLNYTGELKFEKILQYMMNNEYSEIESILMDDE